MPIRRTGALLVLTSLLAAGGLGLASPATAEPDLTEEQWALDAVSAHEAWENSRGAGVIIAVLDTGVDDTHPDLGSEASPVASGPDFTGQDLALGDEFFGLRGTQLAGIAAASGHGEEYEGGTLGAAPDAAILSVRVVPETDDPDGEPDPDAIADGLRHAVLEGAQVALVPAEGGDSADTAQAVRFAQERGVLVVAPVSGEEPHDEVVAVGAVTSDLLPAGQAASPATLSAPGDDIVTTAVGGGYESVSGTDAAAAFVAGVAALVRAQYPQLRPEQVTESLMAGAELPEGAAEESGYGAGVVNAERTLEAAGIHAQDTAPFDENLATSPEEEAAPVWMFWAVGAGAAVLLPIALAVVLRRRWANPYDLPKPDVTPARSERRGAGRRGRRGHARSAQRS